MKTQVLARIAPGHGQAGRDADGRGGAAPGELEFRVSGDQLTVQLQEVRLPAPRSAACSGLLSSRGGCGSASSALAALGSDWPVPLPSILS